MRERLGEGVESFVEACHRMTSGNPLLLRQLLRALEDEGIRPDVTHVDTVRAVGSRAVSALVTMRLRRMPAAVTAAARAVAVLGDAAGLPTVAALAQLPEDDAAAALDTLSRSEILTDEQPPGFVHPLVREAVYDDLPAAERALHHERAATILQRQGAPPEQVVAHLLRAPRRGSADTVALLRAAAVRLRPGVPRTPPSSCCAARSRSRCGRDERAGLLVELGHGRDPRRRPRRGRPPARGLDLFDDPRERAPLAMVVARAQVFVSPPGVATAFAGRPRPQCPPRSTTSGRAWSRCTGSRGSCTAYRRRVPVGSDPGGERRGRRCPDARGRRCLRAAPRRRRTGRGRSRSPRFALEGDRLLAIDNGLLWIVAANVLLLADEDLGDFWDRALARAHATGGLFAALSVNLWRGLHPVARRPGRRRALVAGRRDRAAAHVGHLAVSATYGAAFTLGVLIDRGDLGRPRPAWRPLASCPGSGRAAGCCARARRGCCSRRTGRRRPSTSSPRPSTTPRSPTPRGRRGAG